MLIHIQTRQRGIHQYITSWNTAETRNDIRMATTYMNKKPNHQDKMMINIAK